jgi:hyperosmotically inducible protein
LFAWLAPVVLVCATTVACAKTDPGITTAVKSKFATDDTVKSYKIDVDTKDKIVTLKGEVDTEAAKARAIELARATEGVRDVVDDLTVTPAAAPTTGVDEPQKRPADEKPSETGGTFTDASITASVKTKMLADTDVGGLKIDVDTAKGVVTLTGDVTSAAEKKRAIEIAKETDGVKSVRDKLKIAAKK